MIYDQPVDVRQQIIRNWQNSYLPPLRALGKTFTALFRQVWVKLSPRFPKVIGFPRIPVHRTQGQGFPYNFIQFSAGDLPETIETDVLIVGSGCGAGVCAKNLAEAGQRVLVVEKGYHFEPQHLPMTENEGGVHLFSNGGADFSDDQSMLVVSGQTWGGGGTINWSASLQTQSFVRQEWADEGLSFFTSAEFQQSLDRVCERMGASAAHIKHNKTNRVLIEGARKLGLNSRPVPQNTGGKQHYCGYCTYGCGAAEKQGPVVSWLPDAAKAGARFIEGFNAEKILFDNAKSLGGNKQATGLTGTWTSRDTNGVVSESSRYKRTVNIKAKRIIVSCGTLNSPLLLIRSGLTNAQIGRNLHLHPVTVTGAVFPETVNPWEGGILTTVVDTLQDLDGHGHGPKLEAITMMPALMLPGIPWTNAKDWKEIAAKFKNMVGFISLARDRDTGYVYPDKNDGKTRIAYNPSQHDRKSMLEGAITNAKMAFIEGATEIIHCVPGVPIYKRDAAEATSQGINAPSFQAWLQLVRKRGMPDPDCTFASAHQMGTCRMSTSPRSGVVDPQGKVWGTEGLYVADASVFPSASGVNPMITNMAISDWISRGVAKEMQAESEGGQRARL